MYGMIHRAVRELVIERTGAAAWEAIEREAGVGPAELISAAVYPDPLTLRVVAAAAAQMGMETADFLRMFGRHWVRFAGSGPYAGIMDFAGHDLAGFISNLDRMHRAVQSAMPEARVPQFTLVRADAAGLVVRYGSAREGLEPFVVGLLEGLMERFGHGGAVGLGERTEEGTLFYVMLRKETAP